MILEPQPGPQTQFASTSAEIAIFGGGAGSGKSFSLLMDPLRNANNPRFNAVIFRRETPQITNPGGLWSEAMKLYTPGGAIPQISRLTFHFPSGMRVKFSHLEMEQTVYNWQGSQIPMIGFDELTHFSRDQFFYMLSRNRSDSGVRGRIRATCNADSDSWVAKFIDWWLDPNTGIAIPERSGKIRWFIRDGDEIVWADSKEEFPPGALPKSVTFIPAKLSDNKILMKNDPSYLANLQALPKVERERLLEANWRIKPTAGLFFRKEWFPMVKEAPHGDFTIRYWDRAATEKTSSNDPACTVGLKMRRGHDGRFYVMDVVRGQWSPGQVEAVIKNTASQDGSEVIVGIEQDPGQAGVVEATQYVKLLPGYIVKLNPARKDKETRAMPVSAQAEAGNIVIVEGRWNDVFFDELENFPESKKKDQIDSLSGAFALLLEMHKIQPRIRSL